MCRPFLLSRDGLSLLECLTVLSLTLLFASLALPQVNRFWQTYQLDSATQVLGANLGLARYTAISKDVNVVVSLYVLAGYYELFEDRNANGLRETDEPMLGFSSLPRSVKFEGSGLLGPPSSPTSPVTDPITFNADRVIFNSKGRLNGGLGTIYLKNGSGDATAISYNIASRMKTYRWDKTRATWK